MEKVVSSHNVEFGYDLIAALPHAYWHHLNGTLKGTESGVGSDPFYFFSPDHRIDPAPRDFAHTNEAVHHVPNIRIHKAELDETQWEPPPLAEHYREQALRFMKPTVVIYNRYNVEWNKPPINYFDLDTLRSLISALRSRYTIVYFNVRGQEALEDNAHSLDLGDYKMLQEEYPEVIVIHDLVRDLGQDYNTVQLRVFAGCRKFVTMNGGGAILASYFGGENIIYTRECREILPHVNSFYGWYHRLNKADPSHVRVVHSYQDLLKTVRMAWVHNPPLLNILVRTHNRPKGFERLYRSILKQNYPNVRIIVSYDNNTSLSYLKRYPVTRVKVSPCERPLKPEGDDYKGFLPANTYLNTLLHHVTGGYVLFIDDDDYYFENAFDYLVPHLAPSRIVLWRVESREGYPNLVPSDENFGRIVAGDISGIGFAAHHSVAKQAQWTPWRRGDYRYIRDLSAVAAPTYLNKLIAKIGERIDQQVFNDHEVAARIEQRAAELRATMFK